MASAPFRIIEQSRLRPLIALPISILFGVVGVFMVQDPEGSGRYSAGYVTLMGLAAIGMAGWMALRIIKLLSNPMRLVLNREGFKVENGDGRGLIRWSDVTPFELVRLRGIRLVRYQIVADGPVMPVLSDRYLPGNLDLSAPDLFDVMENSRQIHGRVRHP